MSIIGSGRQPDDEDELPVWLPPWHPPRLNLPPLPLVDRGLADEPRDGGPLEDEPRGASTEASRDDRKPGKKGREKDREKPGKKGGKKQRKKDRKLQQRSLVTPAPRGTSAPPIHLPSPGAAGGTEPDTAPPGDAPEAPEPVADEGPPDGDGDGRDPNRIGVVFIHDIDARKPGETLVAWSRPILRLLTAWATTTPGVRPQNDPTMSAGLDFTGARRPVVTASVAAVGEHPAQTWVMTEAWWATQISPPSLGAMLRWLLPGELLRIWTGIVSGMAGRAGLLFRLADVVLLPLLLVPAVAVVIVAAIALRLLGAVPWRPVQDAATRMTLRLFLLGRFADVRILLADRVQAANARGRVAEAIRDCRAAGCGTVVLIGHSSGALVGYMTLVDETYAALPVRELITVGQTLGTAWRLGHADEYDVPDRSPDRLYRGDRLRRNLAGLPSRAGLRWHDFWASHDPGPAGALTTGTRVAFPELVGGASIPVLNRMSLRRDHDTYWDNDEEFVLPVARLIDEAPVGPPRRSRFFPEGPSTRRIERRRHRVRLFRFAWIAILVAAVASLPLAILAPLAPGDATGLETAGRAARDALATLVENLRPTLDSAGVAVSIGSVDRNAAILIGLAAILGGYWLAAQITTWLWVAWDARERRIALQPIPEWRSTVWLAIQLGLSAVAGLWLLAATATGNWSFALPYAAALVLAVIAGAVTRRGQIRRPTVQELAYEDVLP